MSHSVTIRCNFSLVHHNQFSYKLCCDLKLRCSFGKKITKENNFEMKALCCRLKLGGPQQKIKIALPETFVG